jgi:hypothetical protein
MEDGNFCDEYGIDMKPVIVEDYKQATKWGKQPINRWCSNDKKILGHRSNNH